MPPSPTPLTIALRTGETLLIGAVGGILFTLIGFPAGLIAGSVVAVAAAALIGRPMTVPLWLARLTFVVVGISLGAVVTPETLKGIAAWPISIAILAVAIGCMIAGQFPMLNARIEPAASVARARAYFKSSQSPNWYYVEMVPADGGGFSGKLPRPKVEATPVTYYIQATTTEFGDEQRTPLSNVLPVMMSRAAFLRSAERSM